MNPNRQHYTRYDADVDEEDVSSGYPDELPRVVPRNAVYRATESHQAIRSVPQRRASTIPARASRIQVTPGPPPRRQADRRTTGTLPRRAHLHPLVFLGLALIIALLGYVVFTSVLTWV